MKPVATALVLIVGAAVVLWFGNTLNSWVLGGLIGGLAAILLSIPISLTLFSYFSRRHDEQMRVEMQDEVSLARVYDYSDYSPASEHDAYAVESYMLSPTDEAWNEETEAYEEDYRSGYVAPELDRGLPSPAYPRLPAPGQRSPSERLPARNQEAPTPRDKNASGRRSQRRSYYPGPLTRGQHLSAALRAARIEAAQQFDDVEVLPSHSSRRVPPVRSSQSFSDPSGRLPRSTRQLDSSSYDPRSQRSRRPSNSLPSPNVSRRALPGEEESTTDQSLDNRSHQSSYRDNHYPHTEPMDQLPVPGKSVRRPRLSRELPAESEYDSGNLQKPLVRRAPYLYDDDPLRQEFAQHLDAPVVRRSSRHLPMQFDRDGDTY